MSIPAEGTLLAGKYRVTGMLGEGGMGLVVEAVHEQLEQRVAIKFLKPEALAHGSLVTRFAREARAMIRIRSEHVARVIDVGTLDTGAPYMVMEYLEGTDLEGKVAREGPLPTDRAVALVLQACEALAEAHTLGIIHRDLKPANLFLTARADGSDCVKVLDFGISKTRPGASEPDVSLTQTSALLGSPLYMAPEQMSSAKEVDARTDVWALGAIVFELLTGSPPYPADSVLEIQLRMQQRRPVDMRALRDDVPEALRAVVMRCLEYEPADRYADLAELAVALEPFAPEAKLSVARIRKVLGSSASRADSSRPSPLARTELAPASPGPQRASPFDSASAHVAAATPAPTGSRRLWVGLAGLGLAFLLSAALFARTGARRTSPDPAPVQAALPVAPETQHSSPSSEPPPPTAPASSSSPPALASEPASTRTVIGQSKTAAKKTSPPVLEDKPAEQPPAPPAPSPADLFNTRK